MWYGVGATVGAIGILLWQMGQTGPALIFVGGVLVYMLARVVFHNLP